jgi:hypothetical protein
MASPRSIEESMSETEGVVEEDGARLVPIEVVPEGLRERIGPDGGRQLKMSVARAMLPMPPDHLIAVLGYLAYEPDDEIAQAARASVGDVPDNFLRETLENPSTPMALLDHYGRMLEDEELIKLVLLNPSAPDDVVRFHAGRIKDPRTLDMIAQNQVRLIRHPAIVEALYYNPETRMGAIARAVESVARAGVSLSHIPGFREVEASILGEDLLQDRYAEEDAAEKSRNLEVLDGLADDDFHRLLREASVEQEDLGEIGEAEEDARKPLWSAIADMTVAQKVRLALTGNASARRYLIRDPKRVVSSAVLRSPGISDKEVHSFSGQKSLPEDVIRYIAMNREWTRHYQVKMNLIKNPKTPPQQSMWFIKSLLPSDLKAIVKDRDVPGVVKKTARRMLQQREKKSGR